MNLIGVISDTHGMLRTAAVDALKGVDAIIHAGDVGEKEVLAALKKIAPVYAVKGNMDGGPLRTALPATELLEVENIRIYVLHNIDLLDLDPKTSGISCVIYGHTHEPSFTQKDGVIYLNPGSAGPRRFRLPVTLAMLSVDSSGENTRLEPRFINLE